MWSGLNFLALINPAGGAQGRVQCTALATSLHGPAHKQSAHRQGCSTAQAGQLLGQVLVGRHPSAVADAPRTAASTHPAVSHAHSAAGKTPYSSRAPPPCPCLLPPHKRALAKALQTNDPTDAAAKSSSSSSRLFSLECIALNCASRPCSPQGLSLPAPALSGVVERPSAEAAAGHCTAHAIHAQNRAGLGGRGAEGGGLQRGGCSLSLVTQVMGRRLGAPPAAWVCAPRPRTGRARGAPAPRPPRPCLSGTCRCCCVSSA